MSAFVICSKNKFFRNKFLTGRVLHSPGVCSNTTRIKNSEPLTIPCGLTSCDSSDFNTVFCGASNVVRALVHQEDWHYSFFSFLQFLRIFEESTFYYKMSVTLGSLEELWKINKASFFRSLAIIGLHCITLFGSFNSGTPKRRFCPADQFYRTIRTSVFRQSDICRPFLLNGKASRLFFFQEI